MQSVLNSGPMQPKEEYANIYFTVSFPLLASFCSYYLECRATMLRVSMFESFQPMIFVIVHARLYHFWYIVFQKRNVHCYFNFRPQRTL